MSALLLAWWFLFFFGFFFACFFIPSLQVTLVLFLLRSVKMRGRSLSLRFSSCESESESQDSLSLLEASHDIDDNNNDHSGNDDLMMLALPAVSANKRRRVDTTRASSLVLLLNKSSTERRKRTRRTRRGTRRSNKAEHGNMNMKHASRATWSQLARTSAMSVFEFLPIKVIFACVVRVCTRWTQIITHRSFIIGYYHKVMQSGSNTVMDLTLFENSANALSKLKVAMIRQELKKRNITRTSLSSSAVPM